MRASGPPARGLLLLAVTCRGGLTGAGATGFAIVAAASASFLAARRDRTLAAKFAAVPACRRPVVFDPDVGLDRACGVLPTPCSSSGCVSAQHAWWCRRISEAELCVS